MQEPTTEPRIGVYVCHCGSNIEGIVDTAKVSYFASHLPNVIVSRNFKFMCSDEGQNIIKDDIRENNLNRIVVASCSPRMHEPTFRRACRDAGLNQYLFTMANIREQVSWVTIDQKEATEKAKDLVSAAISRASLLEQLPTREVDIEPASLVVGGGIAGISAALKMAAGGIKVYLVEREPSIGGHMAYLDKTFPTLDCAACILTPKMVDVANNSNIEILSYSEVEDVSGFVGNFTVKVRKKARYVNLETCTACNDCTQVCPIEVPDEFELGHSKRKAIYRMFPQAVPNKFLIDKKETSPCKVACLIDQDAAGYVTLVSKGKYAEAMKLIRRVNPLPAICGRVCYHPCEANCRRGKLDQSLSIRYLKRFVYDWARKNNECMQPPQIEERKKKKVAIIGSGPAGLACAHDLALQGYSSVIYESLPVPGGMMRVGIPSYRLPDDILDREIDYIIKMGVEIKTSTMVGKDITLKELQKNFNAIFIATGAHIGTTGGLEYKHVQGAFQGVDFLREVNLGGKTEISGKVIVIGGGNTAMDASRVALRSGASSVEVVYRRTREQMPADPEEIAEAESEGIKFTFLKAPIGFETDDDGNVTGLNCQDMELGALDSSGRPRPVPKRGSEHILKCDQVILAIGQKPDNSFNKNGLDLQFTDWDSIVVNEQTKTTNATGVFAGGDAVRGPATVLEAIADGKKSAESIVRYLQGESFEAISKEVSSPQEELKEAIDWRERYPDIPWQHRAVMPELKAERRKAHFEEVMLGFSEKDAQREAERCLHCGVCVECRQCEVACQPGSINHSDKDELVELKMGTIVVATGYQLFNPKPMERFGYGIFPDVITSLEFERMVNATGFSDGKIFTSQGKVPESVAIIHCVGSRDVDYHEYCSAVCCMYALKFSHLIKERTGGKAEVYQSYIDMRCYGKGYEQFYRRLLSEDVRFVRGKAAEVTNFTLFPGEEGKLVVRCEDTLAGEIRRIPVDMVILCVAVEPRADSKDVSAMFGLGCSQDGFFLEKHIKLDPTDTATDGVFIAGCAVGPKDIPYSVDQGASAGAAALRLMVTGRVEVESATAEVMEDFCCGCKICNTMCPYTSIAYDDEKGASVVNEALCKGCGTCVASCLSGAIIGKHFTDKQLFAEIEGLMIESSMKKEPSLK